MRISIRAVIFFLVSMVPPQYVLPSSVLIFPHFEDGGGYRTTFLLTNQTSTQTTVTIEFFSSTGSPLNPSSGQTARSQTNLELPANGSVKSVTKGNGAEVVVGWVRVGTSPRVNINGNAIFSLFKDSVLFSEASVPAAEPTAYAEFFADESDGYSSGFAMANPGPNTALGSLTLRKTSGDMIGSYEINLPVGHHVSKFLNQIFDPIEPGRAEVAMNSGNLSLTSLRFHDSSVFSTVSVGSRSLVTSGSCEDIRPAINDLPPDGGVVTLAAGLYTCDEPIVIDRDNVTLTGQGPTTVLRLADAANAPVLIVGQATNQPAVTHKYIRVADLKIDGNRSKQSRETWATVPAIRNNGITLRGVSDVIIERVITHGCRSGGLVTELGCRRVTVRDFASYDNQFDGLAGYETEESIFKGLRLDDNLAAGLSFDRQFNKNIIGDSILGGNQTVGIFMRDSLDNVFHDLQIRNSADHGIFLDQVDADDSTPAAGNSFNGCVVADSGGAGVRVNNSSCVDNTMCGSQFRGNASGALSEVKLGLFRLCVNVVQ